MLYIAAAALLLRFYDLPLKPLHHDEGVNALLLTRLVQPPHAYEYDPANYHGPTLYYLAWLSTSVLGLTTMALRAVPAIAGFVTVLLVLAVRPWLGRVGTLFAAAMLALSPGAVYFSRYFIHETLLICFTLATVVALVTWEHRRRLLYLLLGAAAGGSMFATKETAIISTVAICGAYLGAAFVLSWRNNALLETLRSVARSARVLRTTLLSAVAFCAVFAAVSLLFYTSFFTRWSGALDAVRAFAFWTRTGTSAHTNPFYTYLLWLGREEPTLLLLGGVGATAALVLRNNRFAVFSSLWFLGVFGAYSAIPYKTPWLALNAVVPLALCAGYLWQILWGRQWPARRAARWAAGLLVFGVAGFQAVTLSFAQYDDHRHSYVYVHTFREVLTLVEAVEGIAQRNPGTTIAVTSPEHFPLSWYLRGYRVGFYSRPVVTGDPVVIASAQQATQLERELGNSFELLGSYRLRPGVRLVLFARRDLVR